MRRLLRALRLRVEVNVTYSVVAERIDAMKCEDAVNAMERITAASVEIGSVVESSEGRWMSRPFVRSRWDAVACSRPCKTNCSAKSLRGFLTWRRRVGVGLRQR